MRVDCYNACECPLYSLNAGDTFYLDGALYLKVMREDEVKSSDTVTIVDLARGVICSLPYDTTVAKADTKVVAYGD